MTGLDKILRLSSEGGVQAEPDGIRVLTAAAHSALVEAIDSGDPARMAELVLAAASAVEGLANALYVEGMDDWVEMTAAPADGGILSLAGDGDGGSMPYGNVTYADPGYQGDKKKRYPVDTEEHTRAAWGYINKAKNAGKYTAQQLTSVKGKIKSAMKKHGIGRNLEASAVDGDRPVLYQLANNEAWVMLAAPPAGLGEIAMHHAPFNGPHAHPHAVAMVHSHVHSHMGDNQHGGQMHGSNKGEKAWAAKGEQGWANDRQSWGAPGQ